ncbi:MAG: hypothetical protein PHR77_16870 [Kiritimatiellae bacterium]|nr:hypothetical protein [Kiritimatiellia bacterium]MDD5520591.1 hypothetical protein [Kiritimatiellia bacterium]
MNMILCLVFIAVAVTAVIVMWRGLSGGKCEDKNSECRYDIDALKKTDTNLLIRTGVCFIKPSISNLKALAVDCSDNIYVGGNTGIEILDSAGIRISGFAISEPVHCLSVSPYGDILAGLKDHIEVYGRDGTRKAVWKSPDFKTELTSISASSTFVFAADYVNRIVWRYSPGGELLGRVGDKDNAQRKTGFVVPSAFFDVSVANDGSLWAASPGQHRLEHFSPDGGFISYWGKAGLDAKSFCGCCNPSNFALMPDGSFVTSEKHIVRVKVYDPEGRFKGIISGQEEWSKGAVGLDLAVDSRGRILVLDPQAGTVRLYSKM